MNTRSRILVALLLALPAVAAAAGGTGARVQAGDATRGGALFRLHCAACHGADARGSGPMAGQLGTPAPTDLRDVAFLMQRSDDDLQRAIAQGGRAAKGSFTMPAFAGQVAPLDLWDLVAFVRQGQPAVGEFFASAARFTAKSYTIDADGQKRLEPVLGKLGAAEAQVVVAIAFGGEKESDEPIFVPQDPRLLDNLKPKQKLGYLAFVSAMVPGVGDVPLSIALDKDGAILAVRLRTESLPEKDRAAAEALLAGYEGQGARRTPYQELLPPKAAAAAAKEAQDAKDKDPKAKKDPRKAGKKPEDSKDAQDMAKALTRGYLRAVEGATAFDKEERDRHWAD